MVGLGADATMAGSPEFGFPHFGSEQPYCDPGSGSLRGRAVWPENRGGWVTNRHSHQIFVQPNTQISWGYFSGAEFLRYAPSGLAKTGQPHLVFRPRGRRLDVVQI
jgi:hypothetical protein